jgi:hypothetical protein
MIIATAIRPRRPPLNKREKIMIMIGTAQMFWFVIMGMIQSKRGLAMVVLKNRKTALSM